MLPNHHTATYAFIDSNLTVDVLFDTLLLVQNSISDSFWLKNSLLVFLPHALYWAIKKLIRRLCVAVLELVPLRGDTKFKPRPQIRGSFRNIWHAPRLYIRDNFRSPSLPQEQWTLTVIIFEWTKAANVAFHMRSCDTSGKNLSGLQADNGSYQTTLRSFLADIASPDAKRQACFTSTFPFCHPSPPKVSKQKWPWFHTGVHQTHNSIKLTVLFYSSIVFFCTAKICTSFLNVFIAHPRL